MPGKSPDPNHPQARIVAAAEKILRLQQQPEVGTKVWHEMAEQVYRELKQAVLDEEVRRLKENPCANHTPCPAPALRRLVDEFADDKGNSDVSVIGKYLKEIANGCEDHTLDSTLNQAVRAMTDVLGALTRRAWGTDTKDPNVRASLLGDALTWMWLLMYYEAPAEAFANGVTDDTGIDEGQVRASQLIEQARIALRMCGYRTTGLTPPIRGRRTKK